MITFEEYGLLESYIGHENFKILLEKNLSSDINKDIKFGIVMATHDMNAGRANKSRAKHMNTPGVLTDALNSIKKQKYKNWKIYLTADKYEGDEGEIKKVMEDIIPKDQIQYKNRTTAGERDNKKWSTKQIRFTAGSGALNDSLDMAKKDGCDYIVRIDHDDKWAPNHLEILAKAYTQFPELGFCFTRSKKKVTAHNTSKKIFMQPQKDYDMDLNNKGYGANDTSHSATSWRPSMTGDLRYRNPDKQRNTAPKLKGAPTGSDGILPADWDMFKRIMMNVKDKGKNYMYVPKVTSFYRNREGKF